MQNNQLDIDRDGDSVKNTRLNEGNTTAGTIIFKITGAGSLQGIDAARGLIAPFNDLNADDTYTVVPFEIADTGNSAPKTQPVTATPVQSQPKPAPLQYAPVGATVLMVGIALWHRR